ncbi:hypothetical protein QAD02_010788 [Eretmocerus hayati]|uniref:Uncharacterized protein n=1 Tax=Eretmocerus hayati TaxID=131215 RepID=A0ACC2NVA1_9HYME|nr:hypothetical protein QAD02_010788 [Eretmocerus hayati]
MKNFKNTLLITTIIAMISGISCLTSERSVITKREISNKNQQNPILITYGIENYTMWYIKCDTKNHESIVGCLIVIHNDLSAKNTTRCRFYLHATSSNFVSAADSIKSYRLGEKILISWIDYTLYGPSMRVHILHADDELVYPEMFLNFILVSMWNCSDMRASKTRGTEYNPDNFNHQTLMENHVVYLNDDSFDVFYVYKEDFQWVQERFSVDGRRLSEPVLRKKFHVNDNAVVLADYPKNVDGLIHNQERYKIQEVCEDEIPCKTMKINTDRKSQSTANGYRGFCTKNGPDSWLCHKKFYHSDSSFMLEFDYEPLHFMIYNIPYELILTVTSKKLPTGGLLILMTAFVLDMVEFGFNLREYEPVEIVRLDTIPWQIMAHAFQTKYETVCLSIVFSIDTDDVHNRVDCLPRKDLTVKKTSIKNEGH